MAEMKKLGKDQLTTLGKNKLMKKEAKGINIFIRRES